MQDKSYQITLNKPLLKRLFNRLSVSVTSHTDYAELINTDNHQNPIIKSLSDDLFLQYDHLEKYINQILETSTEVE